MSCKKLKVLIGTPPIGGGNSTTEIDGGAANSVYLVSQSIDGGNA